MNGVWHTIMPLFFCCYSGMVLGSNRVPVWLLRCCLTPIHDWYINHVICFVNTLANICVLVIFIPGKYALFLIWCLSAIWQDTAWLLSDRQDWTLCCCVTQVWAMCWTGVGQVLDRCWTGVATVWQGASMATKMLPDTYTWLIHQSCNLFCKYPN